MPTDAWITAAVLVATFGVLVVDRLPPAAVVLGAAVGLSVAGVIEVDQALEGFANPAPITVAALFVMAAGAQSTGLFTAAVPRLLAGRSERGTLTRLTVPTAAASGLVNNTPLVAMLIPEVTAWARRHGRSPSRYLLPLSYATILGGTLTTLGTSTNLLVSGLVRDRTGEDLALFRPAAIGGAVLVVGLIVLLTVSVRVLPQRRSPTDRVTDSTKEFTIEMAVLRDGPMVGRSVRDAGLRALNGVYLVEISRSGRQLAPVAPAEILAPGDILRFAGATDDVLDLLRLPGLERTDDHPISATPGRRLYEVVVGRMSPVNGLLLRDADFRGRYGAAVLAIHRAGEPVTGKLGDIRLRHGDTLVLLAGRGFRRRWSEARDFLVVADLDAPPPAVTRKAPLAAAILLAFVVISATGLVRTVEAALLAAGALVASRVLTWDQAKRSIDLDVVVLIAAAFGLGAAVQTSGLSAEVASGFISVAGDAGPFTTILCIVVATAVLTEVVTNNAAAVVIFPVAMDIAVGSGLDETWVAVAVALAASTSFLSPIGYQTNTMVYGPGGYRFSDYLRAGAPLSVAVLLTITVMTTVLA